MAAGMLLMLHPRQCAMRHHPADDLKSATKVGLAYIKSASDFKVVLTLAADLTIAASGGDTNGEQTMPLHTQRVMAAVWITRWQCFVPPHFLRPTHHLAPCLCSLPKEQPGRGSGG